MAQEPTSAHPIRNDSSEQAGAPTPSMALAAWHLGALLLAGLVLFWPALNNGFVYSDIAEVADNPLLRDPSDYASTVFAPQDASNAVIADYYRPLAGISFALDYAMHANPLTGLLNPSGVHATTMALYLAVVLLAYIVLLLVTRRPWFAALASAIFLVHPMHAENANYIASRGTTLAALFVLAMLLGAWARPRSMALKTFQAAGVFFLALFAMLSAPAGLAAPILLGLADWRRRRVGQDAMAQWGIRYGAVLGALVAWLGLNLVLFGSIVPGGIASDYARELSVGGRLMLPFQAALRYVALAVFPYPPTVIYGPQTSFVHALLVPGGVALILLAVLAIAAVLAARKMDEVGFGALWFGAAIVPVAIWSLFQPLIIAESRLLLPSLGACVILARLAFALIDSAKPLLEGTRNTAAPAAIAIVLAVLASVTYTRGADWVDGQSLWRAEQALHPDHEQVLASLAFYEVQAGDMQRAEDLYARALDNYESREMTFHDLALVMMTNGKPERAKAVLDQALELQGIHDGAFYAQIGLLCEHLGEWDKAYAAYEKGLEVAPREWIVHFNLGNLLLAQKRYDEAIEHLSAAIDEAPEVSLTPLLINRSEAYRGAGDIGKAIADAERLKEVNPFESRAYTLLAAAKMTEATNISGEEDPDLEKRNQLAREAITILQEGLANMQTPSRQLLLRLAYLQYEMGYMEQAIYNAQRASRSFPRDLGVQVFLGTLFMEDNQYRQMGQHYTRVLNEIPAASADSRVLAGLGYAFFQLGAYDDARALCERALRINKMSPIGLVLYRDLAERNIPVDVDLTGVPPIFQTQDGETPGELRSIVDEPMELQSRETLAP